MGTRLGRTTTARGDTLPSGSALKARRRRCSLGNDDERPLLAASKKGERFSTGVPLGLAIRRLQTRERWLDVADAHSLADVVYRDHIAALAAALEIPRWQVVTRAIDAYAKRLRRGRRSKPA
jgi:hypothetical protein